MKNAQKLLALLFFTTLLFSCTTDDITEDGSINPLELVASGGEDPDDPDNGKDPDGD